MIVPSVVINEAKRKVEPEGSNSSEALGKNVATLGRTENCAKSPQALQSNIAPSA